MPSDQFTGVKAIIWGRAEWLAASPINIILQSERAAALQWVQSHCGGAEAAPNGESSPRMEHVWGEGEDEGEGEGENATEENPSGTASELHLNWPLSTALCQNRIRPCLPDQTPKTHAALLGPDDPPARARGRGPRWMRCGCVKRVDGQKRRLQFGPFPQNCLRLTASHPDASANARREALGVAPHPSAHK
ncbi:hypothetical protein EG329_000511 [Mollisiaceae sp. DMI_Dod_QoI]|nr:hypothetical protein EG329_000511 [Helotiales sp. DMI_Dod_QoI]